MLSNRKEVVCLAFGHVGVASCDCKLLILFSFAHIFANVNYQVVVWVDLDNSDVGGDGLAREVGVNRGVSRCVHIVLGNNSGEPSSQKLNIGLNQTSDALAWAFRSQAVGQPLDLIRSPDFCLDAGAVLQVEVVESESISPDSIPNPSERVWIDVLNSLDVVGASAFNDDGLDARQNGCQQKHFDFKFELVFCLKR